jgi:hypothetical protein
MLPRSIAPFKVINGHSAAKAYELDCGCTYLGVHHRRLNEDSLRPFIYPSTSFECNEVHLHIAGSQKDHSIRMLVGRQRSTTSFRSCILPGFDHVYDVWLTECELWRSYQETAPVWIEAYDRTVDCA